jgi:hypothetical protein
LTSLDLSSNYQICGIDNDGYGTFDASGNTHHFYRIPNSHDCLCLGVTALANAIPDMRALSIANVMGNNIGKEVLSMLQEIMHSKPNLVSLCGIADDATEADLSGLGMDADDAIILASELPNKRAMSVLNLADNAIGGYLDLCYSKFISTPEGMTSLYCDATHRYSNPVDIRSCCYR